MPWAQSGTRLAARLRCRHVVALCSLALSGIACGKKPDPADTLSSIASELATASLAGEAWIAHRTSNSFTSNTLRDSRMSVADQEKILFSEAVPRLDTASLRASIDRGKSALATMEQLIGRQDWKSFPAALALFKTDAERVKRMSDSLESSQ